MFSQAWAAFWGQEISPAEPIGIKRRLELSDGLHGIHRKNLGNEFQRAEGRQLFVTRKGLFGLTHAPLFGDEIICVTPSLEWPFILRKDGSHYRFVGCCFVLGLMDGEAIKWAEKGEIGYQEFGIH